MGGFKPIERARTREIKIVGTDFRDGIDQLAAWDFPHATPRNARGIPPGIALWRTREARAGARRRQWDGGTEAAVCDSPYAYPSATP